MANVSDAMKKRQAEQAAQAAAARAAEEARADQGNAGEQAASAPAAQATMASPAAPAKPEPAPKKGKHHRHGSARANGEGYSELIKAYHEPGSSIAEEYRALRIKLTAECNDGRICTMITSSDPGEGKTVTCANLAVVLAEREDRKTIVVDADVRKGSLSNLFGVPREPGLADVLKANLGYREAIHATRLPNLFVLPSGRAGNQHVGELLVRPELEDLVNRLRREYDYVLFDTPPMDTKTPDAGMIGRAAGQALLVVRMNKTRKESVEEAIRQLHGSKVEVNGLILTGREFTIPGYLYGGPRRKYYYGYYQ